MVADGTEVIHGQRDTKDLADYLLKDLGTTAVELLREVSKAKLPPRSKA